MERKNYFTKKTIMAVMTTVCLFASGCSSVASTSDSAAIVDTTKPVITIAEKEIKVTVNGKLNVSTNVKVEDNTDGRLKEVKKLEDGKAGYVVDDDKVDPTKVGTYTVSVTAVDSAGNKAKSSFSVKVTENKETEKSESKSESSSGNSSATKAKYRQFFQLWKL